MKKFWNRKNVITIIASACALALMVGTGVFAYNEYGAQNNMTASSFSNEEMGLKAIAPEDIGPNSGAKVDEENIPEVCDIFMTSFGDSKIKVIKVVKDHTALGLKESKELVESAPVTVMENVSKDEAKTIKAEFEEAGATIELRAPGQK